jgi:hypothetical protein
MTVPVTPPINAEPLHDRAWWAAESERAGTDWQSLGEVAAAVLIDLALMPCPTCEHMPCQTPSFCEQCRQADHEERTTAMSNDQFDNTNRGVLFNNRDRKETDKDRDYAGNINIEGREFWLSDWIKTSKKGLKFLSLSVKPKEVESSGAEVDLKDEIPF